MVQCTRQWTRVLIVDDHPAIREALGSCASRDCDLEICGEAADSAEALRLLDSTRPDVAVVDIALKAGDGIELIKRIRSHCDSVRIVGARPLDSLLSGPAGRRWNSRRPDLRFERQACRVSGSRSGQPR